MTVVGSAASETFRPATRTGEEYDRRWVVCGYSSEPKKADAQRFQDAVDARVLDRMRDDNRLNKRETLLTRG